MIKMEFEANRLELKKSFRISRDVYDHKNGFIVRLEYGGLIGFGEAYEHVYYEVDTRILKKDLTRIQTFLSGSSISHPLENYNKLRQLDGIHPFSLSAADNAYWDLYAKINQAPTRTFFNLGEPTNSEVKSSFTLSIDETSVMEEECRKHNFDFYKVKLGTDRDMEIMQALYSATDAKFYVDANCGWNSAAAIEFARTFSDGRLCMIEQPLKADEWVEMEGLKREIEIPLIADESFRVINDVAHSVKSFHGINIKLAKNGGISAAIEMIKEARKNKLQVMLGCMMESSIGIGAALQLAKWVDYVDLDSFLFLKRDSGDGLVILENGVMVLPEGNGHGVGVGGK